MNWIYEGKEILSTTDLPDSNQEDFGFIYCIVLNYKGKSYEYYGKKNFFSVRTKRASAKQIKLLGKSAFRRKKQKIGKDKGEWYYYEIARTEMKWQEYNSSSKEVLEMIKDGAHYTKYIVQLVKEERMMNYYEAKSQFCSSVLEDSRFLNDNILGRFFKKNIMQI